VIFSLHCFDPIGWVTGRASGLKKLDVGGDDLTGALQDL